MDAKKVTFQPYCGQLCMDDSQENEGSSDPLPPPPKEVEHTEPHTDKEQPKKHVVINDDVQVFQIIPDSTEVVLIPPPPRKKSDTDEDILNNVISNTMEILNMYRHRCMVMKSTARKTVYMLYRIRQSVQLYADHLDKLKNFFCQHDQIQSKCYFEFCYRLPNYGDYLKVLRDSEGTIQLEGLPQPVAQTKVRKVVEGVIDNVYNGGLFVLAERSFCKAIDCRVRDKLFVEYTDPLAQRSALLNKIDDYQRMIREILSDLTSQINYFQADRLDPIISDFN